MIFGYSTNAFIKFSLAEAVDRIAALGFQGVEIMCDRPHLYPPDFDDEERLSLKNLLNTRKLKVTNLNSFTLFAVGNTYLPSWIEPGKERRRQRIEHTSQCLNLAHSLDCGNISIPPGGPLGKVTRKEGFSLFHQSLEQVIPLAESLGVKLLVEPEPALLIERTGEFKEFIKDVRSAAVGLNFDIGHFSCAGEDPAAAFEELFQWVGHVHVEDIAPTREHHHLIAGHGAISFLQVFTAMKRLGYSGDMSLELYPYVDTPEAAGKESLEFLRPIIEESGLSLS